MIKNKVIAYKLYIENMLKQSYFTVESYHFFCN